MTEKDLAGRIVDILKENNIRKDVRSIRMVLHISDDEGHTKDFVAKKPRTDVMFDKRDVTLVLQAFMAAVSDAILNGEEVKMFNFGTFKIKQKAASKGRHPETKEIFDIPSYYYPAFTYAKRIKNAAKLYTASEKEMDGINKDLISDIYNAIDNGFDYDDDDQEEDEEF